MQNSVSVYLADRSAASGGELLARAAADYTGQNTSAWQKKTAPGGKPYFPEAPQLFFSISHSGAFWACAFAERPLGLDLQEKKPVPYVRLASRFFRPEETSWLLAQADRQAAFFALWTAKESYLKYLGSGFPAKLGAFCVLSALPNGEVLQYLSAPDGYTMCLCTERAASVTYKKLSLQ